MDLVRDPYTGKMVDRRTGIPMEPAPGHVEPKRVNFMEQMLNGTGVSERIMAVHSLFNPVTALQEAGQQAEVMLAPDTTGWGRFGAMGGMLSGMAGTVAPMYAASRGAVPATNAMVDALTGINLGNPADFMADEFGGVTLPVADRSITAYHGSPHSFDKFSMDKIGTGEGAQAYGHGLYFAESEGVAKSYRDALQFPRVDGATTPVERVADDLNYHRGDVEAVRGIYEGMAKNGTPEAKALAQEKLAALPEALQKFKGSMYEVKINANPDDFLDWDAPLSAQSGKTKEYVENMRALGADIPDGDVTGADLYKHFSDARQRKNGLGFPKDQDTATREFAREGIPGIKYLDAGSRGTGDGSRNYVVFDENLISIVKKYGIAGAAAILGVSAMDVEQAMAGQQP